MWKITDIRHIDTDRQYIFKKERMIHVWRVDIIGKLDQKLRATE